jgi:hypothetical protein
MFGRLMFTGLALAAAGLLSSANAQQGYTAIGSADVNLARGSAVIDLKDARGSYRGFRVRAVGGDIAIDSVQVRYSDGTFHNERRPINLTSDYSRPIDLGRDKFVEGATICYKTGSGRVTVELLGTQTRSGRNARRPAITQAQTFPPACAGGGGGIATIATPGSRPTTTKPSTPVDTQPTAPIPETAPAGTAFPNGAILFGVQNVGFLRDRDVIKVGGNLGQFERLQLRVLGNDIFINDLDVVYVNGQSQKLVINAPIKQNTRSRWLDIQGDKFIKEIQMTYRSRANFKGQARIEVYGQLARDWLGAKGRGREYNEGWVLLAAQTASRFLRTEVDTIPVGRNEGLFKRVRVTVKDRALVFDELRVVYGNNEEEVFPIKTTVAANSTYGPIDLKSGNRVIKEIKTRYRSAVVDAKAVGRGASVVEIWGQH